VLITKISYDGIPDLQKPFIGSRTLEGVGFFVGRTAPATGANPMSAGPGFLSPFAYFEVSLVDLGSGRVVKEERGLASDSISATSTDTGNPWDALSGSEKVRKLTDLVSRELAIVMPKVLARN
jgi:tRNA-binding EMAP/Myf-like protein